MTEPDSFAMMRGAAAREVVERDPLWSTVVRRHPDVDVVVLPPDPVPAEIDIPAGEPLVEPDGAREELRSSMAALWAALGLDDQPTHLDDTWFAGHVRGTLRWQGTATFDDVDPEVASASLDRAQSTLTPDAGWRVLVPSDGISRVLAGRPGRLGREEFQLLVLPSGRVVLRLRSALVLVGEPAVAVTMAVGSR